MRLANFIVIGGITLIIIFASPLFSGNQFLKFRGWLSTVVLLAIIAVSVLSLSKNKNDDE